mgnify:CR=1 FL=1
MSDLAARVAGLPWETLEAELDARGFATTGPLLDAAECAGLAAMYSDERRFRSRVDMARYRFGVGEYKVFRRTAAGAVAALRENLYPRLAPIANRWMERLGASERYPPPSRVSPGSAPATARPSPRRFSCTTPPAATTACTRISTARWRFRFRPPCS